MRFHAPTTTARLRFRSNDVLANYGRNEAQREPSGAPFLSMTTTIAAVWDLELRFGEHAPVAEAADSEPLELVIGA